MAGDYYFIYIVRIIGGFMFPTPPPTYAGLPLTPAARTILSTPTILTGWFHRRFPVNIIAHFIDRGAG